jgi:hypothetical protein
MLTKPVTGQHGRATWITLWLVILGAVLYGFTVFQYDYFRELKRGRNGQAAIQMLDQTIGNSILPLFARRVDGSGLLLI